MAARLATVRTGADMARMIAAAGAAPDEIAATIFGSEDGFCAEIFRRADGEPIGLAAGSSVKDVHDLLRCAGITEIGEEG